MNTDTIQVIHCNGGFGCTRVATFKQGKDGFISHKCYEHAWDQKTSDFTIIQSFGFISL